MTDSKQFYNAWNQLGSLLTVTLNPKKFEFSKNSLKFLGHIIDQEGILADLEKVCAITEIQPPSYISKLSHLMGMIIQLEKFYPTVLN